MFCFSRETILAGKLKRPALAICFVSAAVLASTSAAPSSAQAPRGQVGVRLIDVASDRASDPRAKLYIIDHVSPGAIFSRHIDASNGSDETVDVKAYAAGAEVKDGSFSFFEDEQGDELSSWIKVEPNAYRLAPHTAMSETVTIKVPASAASGERYAVVWAEFSSPNQAGNVREVSRVGIRVYLSVGEGAEPPTDFEVESLAGFRDAQGNPGISARVRNTGGRAVDLSGEATLSNGPGGLSAGPYPVRLGTTLGIGQTEPVTVPLDRRIPAGPWDAKIVLRSGLVERTATARIKFPAGAGERGPDVKARKAGASVAKEVGILATLFLQAVIIIFLLLLFFRRRRRKEDGEAEDQPRR